MTREPMKNTTDHLNIYHKSELHAPWGKHKKEKFTCMECACGSEDLYTSLQDQNQWHKPVLHDPKKLQM